MDNLMNDIRDSFDAQRIAVPTRLQQGDWAPGQRISSITSMSSAETELTTAGTATTNGEYIHPEFKAPTIAYSYHGAYLDHHAEMTHTHHNEFLHDFDLDFGIFWGQPAKPVDTTSFDFAIFEPLTSTATSVGVNDTSLHAVENVIASRPITVTLGSVEASTEAADVHNSMQCEHCGEVFPRKSALRCHHAKVFKPYKCLRDGCAQGFSSQKDLIRHLTTLKHIEQTMAARADPNSSIPHADLIANVSLFRCPIPGCKATEKGREDNLMRHIRIVHLQGGKEGGARRRRRSGRAPVVSRVLEVVGPEI